MKLNQYLTSTLLAGFCVGALTLSPAMGAEQSLQPSGKWAVTKMDQDSKNAYCTLSRKYDGGVILSLARNETEEYSLAFDFQKPTFTKDKSIKIDLQPGPGQARSYSMMPTSEQAMVIRLGWDDGFFNTLAQSQQMKVKLADKSYSFAMPEIAKGQSDLQDCMEGLKTAKAGGSKKPQTKDVLSAEPVNASKAFSAGKLDEHAQDTAVLAAKDDKLISVSKVSGETNIARDLTAPVKTEAEDVAEKSEEKRRNFGKIEKDKTEIKSAEKKIEKKEAIATAEAERMPRGPSVKPDIEVPAFAPIAQAQKEEEAPVVKDSAPKIAAVSNAEKERIAALEGEASALREQLKNAKTESAKKPDPADLGKLQQRANELEIKNAQLEDSLRKSQIRIGETAINTETKSLRTIADLQVKLDAAQKDNSVLAKQLDDARLRQENSNISVAGGNVDMEQTTKRFNEAEREIRRLAQQNEEQKKSCSVEKAQLEQMLFDPSVTDQKQIEKLTSLQNELSDAKAKLSSQDKLVQTQVDARIAEKTKALDAEKIALTQKMTDLQKATAQKDAAFATSQTEIASLKKISADTQSLVSEKEKFHQQAAALQSELAALKQASAQKDQQLAGAQAASQEVSTLKAQNKSLSDSLEGMKTTLAAAQAAPKVDPVMNKQLADLQTTLVEMKKNNDALRDQNVLLRGEADKLNVQLASMQGQQVGTANQVASAKTELETLKQQISAKDAQATAYQAQMAAVQQENVQLKTRFSSVDTASGAANAQLTQMSGQLQSLQQENAQLKASLASASVVGGSNAGQVAVLSRQVQDPQRPIVAPSQRAAVAPQPVAAQYDSLQPSAGFVTQRSVSYATPQPAIVQPAPAAIAAVPSAAPASGSTSGFTASTIQGLLQSAGLPVSGIKTAAGGISGSDGFSWMDSGNIKGAASVKMMGRDDFDSLVNQYISYQKGQCGGDFASMPSPSNSGAGKRMSLYEIACVGAQQSQSSSLVFFEDQGRFIAISSQTQAADMDLAMDSRDKIANFVRSL